MRVGVPDYNRFIPAAVSGVLVEVGRNAVNIRPGRETYTSSPAAMNPIILKHQQKIEKLCRDFHVQRLELFGSATNASFDPGQSDLDFLVEFAPLANGAYAAAFFGFKDAMEQLLGRSVDLVVASSIRNPYFRQSVEQSKALLYAA